MHIPPYLHTDADISHCSGYATRTIARYYHPVHTDIDVHRLHEIHTYSMYSGVPIIYIGGWKNTLLAHTYYDAIVIKNEYSGYTYDTSTKILTAYTGASIWDIASELESIYSQSIWHRFVGLPGSMGGSIVGNAGCFGLTVANNFVSADILDIHTGTVSTYMRDDMGFVYRGSRWKGDTRYFVISAVFDLSYVSQEYASDVDNIYFREHKQPKWYSCGSFFKNPTPSTPLLMEEKRVSAGSLIEQVGLKWYRYGGARFSDIHANFLLSDGPDVCTGADLVHAVEHVQQVVHTATGIWLEPEVRIVR